MVTSAHSCVIVFKEYFVAGDREGVSCSKGVGLKPGHCGKDSALIGGAQSCVIL